MYTKSRGGLLITATTIFLVAGLVDFQDVAKAGAMPTAGAITPPAVRAIDCKRNKKIIYTSPPNLWINFGSFDIETVVDIPRHALYDLVRTAAGYNGVRHPDDYSTFPETNVKLAAPLLSLLQDTVLIAANKEGSSSYDYGYTSFDCRALIFDPNKGNLYFVSKDGYVFTSKSKVPLPLDPPVGYSKIGCLKAKDFVILKAMLNKLQAEANAKTSVTNANSASSSFVRNMIATQADISNAQAPPRLATSR